MLITETTSYYNYNANVHRRFTRSAMDAVFNGNHSGLSSQRIQPTTASLFYYVEPSSPGLNRQYLSGLGTHSHSAPASCRFRRHRASRTPTSSCTTRRVTAEASPGTPIRRLSLTGTYSRALQQHSVELDLLAEQHRNHLTDRCNIVCAESVSWRATRGSPRESAQQASAGTTTSYFAGITRWFDFF